jgi:hypothetical protein
MQLRHIRPGSLDWQDAQTDEVDQGFERLTPEETVHLRKLSDDKSNGKQRVAKEARGTPTQMQ